MWKRSNIFRAVSHPHPDWRKTEASSPSLLLTPYFGAALLQFCVTTVIYCYYPELIAAGIRIRSWFTPWALDTCILPAYYDTITVSYRIFHHLEDTPCFTYSPLPLPASDSHWSFYHLHCLPKCHVLSIVCPAAFVSFSWCDSSFPFITK